MTVLMALLADIVFESAASTQRSFSREMDRYLEKRGLDKKPAARPATTR
jgi:hypothetical protein